ncbi:Monooxygenase FAD-binding protein [Pseudomonas sp. JV551A1]|uniref:Monooxygenase FAD-binding protein n=1 Tax=Pseudomonas inefficax TaxID=2078786 RepID=A0AAQ1P927_9PSED|nr:MULTISPECIES: bifunctional 3-(3-hydroxy-phenyl)propionate/3-hydroxycinnamic acid hydroxylase [Pseudomonas]SPO54623.1 Monooxygenase FAD-binding protein [Pseudomonas sp. JV551A1]SPO62095.1 Monooxygenase FAD-binding protein [Pseudomonas inefficax]
MAFSQEIPAEPLDVIVAGYGPAGATIAGLLGRRGWRVAVLDQAAAIYDKPRAITADHEALRVLQEIGIADEVAAMSTPHPGTDYTGLEGQVIKRFYPGSDEPLGWMQNWMFEQPKLEGSMRRAVQRMPSVLTLLQHQLLEVSQDADSVEARVCRLTDGTTHTLRARWLVAADGASSTVRKQFSPAIEDLAFDEWWLVVDAWVRGPVELPSRCVQYCRPSRPGTYIVGPDALRRWEIKMLPGETPQQFQDHAEVWRVLGEFVDPSGLEHCRTAIYRFHALVVEQWRHGRVFLLGDAAHQMPPFLGQGLCAAVRDAFNLAWKLDAVMCGRATQQLLDSYTEERKRHVRTVVGHAKAFGLIIGELDEQAARERDKRLEAELVSGAAQTIRAQFTPGLVTGLIDRDVEGVPSVGAGELFVQPWVREGDAQWQRLDDVLGANFAIVATSSEVLSAFDEQTRESWKALEGRLIQIQPQALAANGGACDAWVLQEREALFNGWLERLGAVAAVVRPDRYVYGVACSAEELRRLVHELAQKMFQADAACVSASCDEDCIAVSP